MSLRITDPSQWRGRQQLQGKTTTEGNVVYVSGPRVGRWAWDSSKNSLLSKLEAGVYTAALGTYDGIRTKRTELESSGKLTPAGIADEMVKVGGITKPTLDRAKQQLAEVRREVAERRSKIKPFVSDGAEDPVSTMRKIEARAVMRTMDRRELLRLLAGNNPDPAFVEAALEAAPHMLANIGPTLRNHLESVALQSNFGAEIDELNEIDLAIETASRALEAAEDGIGQEINGDPAGLTRRAGSLFQTA